MPGSGHSDFQDFADRVGDLVQCVDSGGRVRFVNAAWNQVLGYPLQFAVGRSIYEFLSEDSRAHYRTCASAVLGSGQSRELTLTFVAASGRRIRAEGALLTRERGEARRSTVALLRDVSERRSLERLQQEFLATVSHELRTPLTSLLGSLTLLRSREIAENRLQWLELLEIAERNGNRLLRLINDLLDLRRQEVHGLSVRVARVSVTEVLVAAEEGMRGFAESYGVRIEVTSGAEEFEIECDKERLVQVLLNLLSNAIKFTPGGGVVRLSARPEVDQLAIEIIDGGPGAAPEFESKPFQPVMASASRPDRSSRSGLGLAIAKGLVASLEGEIRIDSPPLGGTRATVVLPSPAR